MHCVALGALQGGSPATPCTRWNHALTPSWPLLPACLQFPHIPYLGHHKELGLNGIYLLSTQDCWVKDVAIVNSDNGILIEDVSKCKCLGKLKLVYSSRRAGAVGSLQNKEGMQLPASSELMMHTCELAPLAPHYLL